MKLCSCKPHTLTLCFLTVSVVFVIFYAILFGQFVDKEMKTQTQPSITAQELFDTQSEFSIKGKDGEQGAPQMIGSPKAEPSGVGPSFPPPGN